MKAFSPEPRKRVNPAVATAGLTKRANQNGVVYTPANGKSKPLLYLHELVTLFGRSGSVYSTLRLGITDYALVARIDFFPTRGNWLPTGPTNALTFQWACRLRSHWAFGLLPLHIERVFRRADRSIADSIVTSALWRVRNEGRVA